MRLTSLMSEKQQLLEQVALLKKTNSDLQNEIAAKMQLEGMKIILSILYVLVKITKFSSC